MLFPVPSVCVPMRTQACVCIGGVGMIMCVPMCASVYISALLLYHSKCGSQTENFSPSVTGGKHSNENGLLTSTIRQGNSVFVKLMKRI